MKYRRRVHGKLKECVTTTARGKIFLLKKDKSAVIAERKQFLLILGLLIAVHKSQGSTLAYMQFYVNQSTRKKTVMLKELTTSVSVNFTPCFPVSKVLIRFYCGILNLNILSQMNLL